MRLFPTEVHAKAFVSEDFSEVSLEERDVGGTYLSGPVLSRTSPSGDVCRYYDRDSLPHFDKSIIAGVQFMTQHKQTCWSHRV